MRIKKWLISLLPKKWQNVHKYDKIYHSVGGFIFFLFLTLFFDNWIALIFTIVLGFGIEFYDKEKGGKFDIWDAVATFSIALIHFIIVILL